MTQNENSQQDSFRPLTRSERRSLWLKEYGEQDIALQTWIRLAETQGLEIDVMLQMQGLLVFGTLISTKSYAEYYITLHEEQYRQDAPDTADFLREYYETLIPPPDQPEIGVEGLPVIFHQLHLRDVTLMSAGHKVKLPYWRGKVHAIDAFVLGASVSE